MLLDPGSSPTHGAGPAPATELYEAVLRLIERGRAVDEAIVKQVTGAAASAQTPSLGELMGLKHWLVQALFAIAPRALKANPDRRREILGALSAFRDSHQGAEAVLARYVEELEQELDGARDRDERAQRPRPLRICRAIERYGNGDAARQGDTRLGRRSA